MRVCLSVEAPAQRNFWEIHLHDYGRWFSCWVSQPSTYEYFNWYLRSSPQLSCSHVQLVSITLPSVTVLATNFNIYLTRSLRVTWCLSSFNFICEKRQLDWIIFVVRVASRFMSEFTFQVQTYNFALFIPLRMAITNGWGEDDLTLRDFCFGGKQRAFVSNR